MSFFHTEPVTFVALPVFRPLDSKAGAFWRRAGSDLGWKSADNLIAGDWLNDLPKAIVRNEPALGGMSRIFVMDPEPVPLFGALCQEESDVLGGTRAALLRSNVLSVAIDACAMRLLLRISRDGLTEVLIFTRPEGSSPFVCGQDAGRSISFLVFRRYLDRIVGNARTATRIRDHARSASIPDIFEAAASGSEEEAARLARAMFESEINPAYPVPFRLAPGESRVVGRSEPAEREIQLVLESLLVAHPEIGFPATYTLLYPEHETGIVRFDPASLTAENHIPHPARERITALGGLAALSLPGHGGLTASGADHDPTRGYHPSDADARLCLRVQVGSVPSAHDILEAHVVLARFWASERARPDLSRRLAIVDRRQNPDALSAAIDAWFAP